MELLDSNIETLEVDHKEQYQAYKEYGFLIKFDNKNLILILEDQKKNKKCLYNFITEKYRLYIDGKFKDEYSVMRLFQKADKSVRGRYAFDKAAQGAKRTFITYGF